MYSEYILNQKFDSIRISLLRDITKIWKKLPLSKTSRIFILHDNNNNAKKLSENWWKINFSINNQVTYLFLISNEFIHFLESIWIFFNLFNVHENTVTYPKFVTLRSFFKIVKNVRKQLEKFKWILKNQLIH